MSLPSPYFEDEHQQQQLLASYASSWAQPPPLQPVCAPQFGFPGPDPFTLQVQPNFPSSFRMPSPPVSPSLSSLSGSSFSTDSVTTPTGFVSLANIAPPRNDTVFGWNSIAVAEPEALTAPTESGPKTAEVALRSRNSLKRPASPSPTPSLSSSSSTSPAPMQQPESSPPAPASAPKRQRTQISSKDFVPPDVTGLSKREARLVKNRAAAFLSRQRKREEFEELERHCQDLERENARLQASLGQSPSKKLKASESEPSQDALVELARLREANAELAAQNAQLSAQNAQLTAENARLQQREVSPKVEDDDGSMLLSEPPSRRETKEKHGTGSVALMVLMISLSLLGKPLASGVNNARGRPALTSLHTPSAPQPSSTFDFVLPRTNSDYEWLTSPTDLEHDDFAVPSTSSVSYSAQQQTSTTRTLTVQGLENLEIPSDIRDFNFEMDVDERDARNVVLAVSNPGSSTSSDASSLSSPSSTSISTLDSAWPEPSVDSTMAMLGGDYMSYDYDSDIFASPIQPTVTKQPPAGTRKIAVAVVPSGADGQGRWSVEVKESL
ncbi:bZIP transcription factor [Ceratobasidium sp. AG-Ba]|nr:bZIP transcription factor [Ceratobasidium sp. AG-Ba]